MATYVILLNWTEDGIEDIRESPNRLDEARHSFEEAGAKLGPFYMTFGSHDMVAIAEAPDDETIAKLALALASKGSVRTETLKAFSEEEYRSIIGSL